MRLAPDQRYSIRFLNGMPILPKDMTVIPISKCGSSTLIHSIITKWPDVRPLVCHVDHIKTKYAVSMWRDPDLRAWSAYNYIQAHNHLPWDVHGDGLRYYPESTLPYDEFLYELACNVSQPRWIVTLYPQHEFCTAPVKHIMVPWDFKKMAEILGMDELPHREKSRKGLPAPDLTAEMRYHLNIIYGADYRIWDLIRC